MAYEMNQFPSSLNMASGLGGMPMQQGGGQMSGGFPGMGNFNASFSGQGGMMGQQNPYANTQGGSYGGQGGQFYDPLVRRAEYLGQGGGQMMQGYSPAAQEAIGRSQNEMRMMMQPQGGMDLGSIMGMMKGMMGGMGGMQGFDKIYDQASGKLIDSMGPQQQDAKNALRDQMIAQGGEGALSSGQYQSALGQLDERLAANQSGMLGQLYSSLYGPWQGAQAQMFTAPFTAMASLLSALSGFAR